MEKAKPRKIKQGSISVDIWTNKTKEGDREFKTVTVTRSYKDGEEWKRTNSLRTNDIPKAIMGLQKAYDELTTKEKDAGETPASK